MERAAWEQIQNIFHQVAEFPAEEQEAALIHLCDGDEDLLASVRSLLEEDRRQDSILDVGLASLAYSLVESNHEEPEWARVQQVGPYRIKRMLGEGGMGVVYLAERTDVGGDVAIKLLRDAWLSPERRRRFTKEQRTLAQLNHPGIAQLYDADALPDGTPWFVMEYVDGLPLTEFWARRRGSIEECLWLFRSVCEAVLFAHRRAIIHRDLKPSNILATAEGRIKLLDFGIAKHLDDRESRKDVTLTGLRAMTPAYAAPEQQSGGAVGVFTDVYALGVLLYELLTGELPFDDAVSAIRQGVAEPKRPSSLSQEDRFAAPITRGEWADLNVLCLTAMRFEPERRYQSVEVLIRDIDALLEKRPLEARAESWRYRLGKFVRRHRGRLAYATTTACAIFAILGFFTFRLQQARNDALAEAARTQRIQQFTTNLFQGNDATAGPADDLRVKTLLERGREEAGGLSSDPEMQADMWETLGDIYRKLGDPRQADALLTASLERRKSSQAAHPRKYVQNLVELGLVRVDEARLDEGEQLIRQALDASRTIPQTQEQGTRPAAADAMVALGGVLEAKGNYVEAVSVLEGALKLIPRPEVPDINTAANLRELANAHFYQGHYAVAEKLNRQVLAMHRTLYGEKHPEVAEDLNNLGAIQNEIGNLGEAEAQYRQSLAIVAGWYGPQHPKTAEDLTCLGRVLIKEKKYADSKLVLERALEVQKTIHGHDHPAVASALNELGNLESQQQAYEQAEAHFREALDIWRAVYGNTHQFIGVGLSNLGSVYMGRKDYVRAEAMYRQALNVFLETVHREHTNTGIAYLKLGRALLRQKRYAEAERETLAGYQILSKLVSPANGFVVAAKVDLRQIYTELNRKEEADRYRAE